jgi:hypothetical protein
MQPSRGGNFKQSKINIMEQYQKEHLERVSVDGFEQWKFYSSPFLSFASSSGKHGIIEVGINSDGKPAIKKQGKIHEMSSAEQAINEYHRLYKI